MPQRPVTERQILDAMDEYSEAWVEQLVRRAKNQRLALSDETICTVGDYLTMPDLMDELVSVRVAERGPYTLGDLNPPIGVPSVCEFVTPRMVRRLLTETGGRFSADEAYRFCDYHLTNVDDSLLEQIVRMSDLSHWDAEAILDDLGYTGDVDQLLSCGKRMSVGANPQNQAASVRPSRKRSARRIFFVIVGLLALMATAVVGGILAAGAALIVMVILLAATSSSSPKAERFPDVRSDYNRRIWADDHNFDADGDADHNREADGDQPW